MLKDENDIILLKRVGRELRKLRLSKNISQQDLSKITGMHFTYISSIEKGQRNITIIVLNRLTRALGNEVLEIINNLLINK